MTSQANCTQIGGTMKWTKPEFVIVELCSEVTSYLYHR
jgi:coenzyme PQQ precursor peptide PqqA